MMSEDAYLNLANKLMSDEVRKSIDRTPGRQPSDTILKFFAWDETLCLLTAVHGLEHCYLGERVIYNCGVGLDSAHFKHLELFRSPPFNMIGPDEVWEVF